MLCFHIDGTWNKFFSPKCIAMEMSSLFSAVTVILCVFCVSEVFADRKLIVVLVDGVRWDYINDPKLKGFPRIIKNGVRAPYTVPVFPSLSYPNYQTIATGLYPENHDFVDNYLYDNDTNSFFGMIPKPGTTDQHWWNGSEPIWITAEKNGKRTAVYWWAGCEVQISGTHPTICERQNSPYGPVFDWARLDFLERIDDIVLMFKPTQKFHSDRLSLALMYYGSVDSVGHFSGPDSPELKESMYDIDGILDTMQSKIEEAGLQNDVNIMVMSDHGMTEIRKRISLEKFQSKIQHQISVGAASMILPVPGMLDKLYEELKNENIEGLVVYKKEEIPEDYHIKHSKLTLPLYLRAKKGYEIEGLNDIAKNPAGVYEGFVATHGYDPEETEDMRGIFVATGPDFQKGFETEVLYNTDLYNIMCSVLNIQPQPNNGSFERVKPMLTKYQKPPIVKSSATALKDSDRKAWRKPVEQTRAHKEL